MNTEKIIKILKAEYGYTFSKETKHDKHQFDWLCELIKDTADVVKNNAVLPHVSKMLPTDEEIELKYNTKKINAISFNEDISRAIHKTMQEGAKWMRDEIKKRMQGNFC